MFKKCKKCYIRGVKQIFNPHFFEPKFKGPCYMIGKYITIIKIKINKGI